MKWLVLLLLLFLPISGQYDLQFTPLAFLLFTINSRNHQLNPVNAEKNLGAFTRCAQKHDLPFILTEGTALGAYRQGDFIPGDSDTDIMIFDGGKLKIVLDELILEGFVVCRVPIQLFNSTLGTVVSIMRNREWIDIDVFHREKRCAAMAGPCSQLEPLLQKFETVQLGKSQYYIPSSPERYLEYLYGAEWRIPKNEKPKDVKKK